MNDLSKLTDAQLSAVFAQEVAGMSVLDIWTFALFQKELRCTLPKFSTSLDALMPWLEEVRKAGTRLEIWSIDNGWIVEIHDPHDWGTTQEVEAATLPRAVAEALILWKRAQKGEK